MRRVRPTEVKLAKPPSIKPLISDLTRTIQEQDKIIAQLREELLEARNAFANKGEQK